MFHYSVATLQFSSNPYKFIVDFSEYRTAILSSGSSRLFVWIDFEESNEDPEIYGSQIHAINLTFQHGERLARITAILNRPGLVKHFAWHLQDSRNFSFEWRLSAPPEYRGHLSSPTQEYSYRDFEPKIPAESSVWMYGYSDHYDGNPLLKTWSVISDYREETWSNISRLLAQCTNLTSLRLGNTIFPTLDNERPILKLSLPFLKELCLWDISTPEMQYLFSSMELPRLWKLKTIDASPFYPLHMVTFPHTLNTITCEAYESSIDDTIQQLPNLKSKLCCRLMSEAELASDSKSFQFSCLMSSQDSIPWTMIISIGHNRLQALLRFVRAFQRVYGQNFSHDELWLDSIDQCITELEWRIQEANED